MGGGEQQGEVTLQSLIQMSACKACNWKLISEGKAVLIPMLANMSEWVQEGARDGKTGD